MNTNRIQSRVISGLLAAGLVGTAITSCSGDDKKRVMLAGEAGEGGEAGQGAGGAAGSPAPSGGAGVGLAGAQENGGEGGTLGGAPSFGAAAGALDMGGEGGAAPRGGSGGQSCGSPSTGARITIAFSPGGNAEHVTNLQWLNSASVLTPNLAAEGGPAWCNDPQEFFGQSYGAPENTSPGPVVGGGLSTLVPCGLDTTITSGSMSCKPVAAQLPVTTQYHFYTDQRASEVRITRTFAFDSSTTPFAGTHGLRPFVPRVSASLLPTVIYPNRAGTAVTAATASSCGGDCFTAVGSTWNGQWFADVNATSGLAMIVVRDPAQTTAADLTINYDASSGSNLASFVVLQPSSGWKAPLIETEYLCFADLTSWPQSARDTATLPAGCGP